MIGEPPPRRDKRKRQRIGAHMSIEGGLYRAVERAQDVDATALQIFVKSARQWRAKPLVPAEVARFRKALAASGLAPYTLAHASYLINLAAPDDVVRERSIEALRDEIARCAALGVPFLVVHPGSHVGSGEVAGLERVALALDRALAPAGRRRSADFSTVTVLLENTAGQGSNLGHRFEHLGAIFDTMRNADRLGVCYDTCHALAAGYDFRDARGYRRTMAALEQACGAQRLRAFHFNDSKHALGSRRDRHEHIGRGAVGLEGFRRILADRRFRDLPMVLETPKGPELAEDRENLATLRGLIPASRR